jgi:ATP-dependent RNA helicase RhlE
MGRQVRALLNGVDILVATPGRLIDLVRSNALRLSEVGFLVLDEADRMLDMGFIHDIRTIVAKLPKERQTLFFSATMPQEIAQLAQQMLRDPAKVAVTPPASTAELVEQRIIHVDRAAKPTVLADVLKEETVERALVFTRTKHGADRVVRGLAKAGITAQAIHGNKSQGQRERVLAAFRKGDVRTLVATDIAARGIDVDGISHVVNYDLPNIAETYVHRIGRTARAGASGVAISLCDADEAAFLRDIERLIRTAIPATDRRTHSPRPAVEARPSQGARNRSQPVRHRGNGGRNGGHDSGHHNGHRDAQNKPHTQRAERHRQPERHARPERQQPPERQQRQPERQSQPQRHPRPGRQRPPERHPDDLTGVEFLNRAARVRREDGRRPQR